MKRTDLTAGMEVYYVENSWQWSALTEDVAECRATVVDLEHYIGDNWRGSAQKHPTGKHIHIKVGTYDRYVTGAQLKGVYAEVAPKRAEMQRLKNERAKAESTKRREREEAVRAVAQEAKDLGFLTVGPAYRDRDAAFVELTAAELHAMLAEVREHRQTTVYVAMVADRHAEPEPYVFDTAEAAISYARDEALAVAPNPSAIEEEPVDKWLYHANYAEDSSVWVIKKSVNSTSEDGKQP